ncbi:acyloxyacyl hydrolase [Nitrospinaceae bacterium]|nr:acyloxyacyl hydrolase [Nitrospinaceae bacterium]
MCRILFFWIVTVVIANPVFVGAQNFADRFAKENTSFGGEFGFGHTFDLPPGRDRTDLSFAFIFPNWQKNLTGVIAPDSLLQGALYWHVEAGLAVLTHREHEYLIGFSPVMVNYKFLNSQRKWAPNILAGAGFSMQDWREHAERELGSEFQFLLHAGAGVEIFRESGTYSFNYRLFHVSNAGMDKPNIGLNSHVFSLGYRF